ncbi:MAG: SCO family protein [Anaerolineales bacterium]|nr:SCO family protein [Anaerolineales bacterium]
MKVGWWLKGVYGLAALLFLGVLSFAVFQPIKVLPRITLAPGLALRDEAGRSLSNEDLRGQIVLYNFTFAECAAPCAQMNSVLRAVQHRLPEVNTSGLAVRLVSISIDPARDTPAVLADLAVANGADPDVWRFATGDPLRLKSAVGAGFQLYYGPAPDGRLTVDPLFALVDGGGILRAEYRTAAPAVDRLLRDIGLLAEEARNSTGAGRYAYEAAHLFLCYPR